MRWCSRRPCPCSSLPVRRSSSPSMQMCASPLSCCCLILTRDVLPAAGGARQGAAGHAARPAHCGVRALATGTPEFVAGRRAACHDRQCILPSIAVCCHICAVHCPSSHPLLPSAAITKRMSGCPTGSWGRGDAMQTALRPPGPTAWCCWWVLMCMFTRVLVCSRGKALAGA